MGNKNMDKQEAQNSPHEIERPEYPVFKYANYVTFFPGAYDIKLAFGDTDFDSAQTVNFHTGITLSWQQAKTTLLFLRLNMEIYESRGGEVKIPKTAFSAELQERIPEDYLTMEEALSVIKQAIKDRVLDEK